MTIDTETLLKQVLLTFEATTAMLATYVDPADQGASPAALQVVSALHSLNALRAELGLPELDTSGQAATQLVIEKTSFWPMDLEKSSRKQIHDKMGLMNFTLTALRSQLTTMSLRVANQKKTLSQYELALGKCRASSPGPCANGCQNAKDTGMLESSCAGPCLMANRVS
jgi:hypothetical protein